MCPFDSFVSCTHSSMFIGMHVTSKRYFPFEREKNAVNMLMTPPRSPLPFIHISLFILFHAIIETFLNPHLVRQFFSLPP